MPFHSSLVFGEKTGFALYFGTVPRLAINSGLQPVVYILAMEELFAVPIASSVDPFFLLYSHYFERMVADPNYTGSGIASVTFPWDMAHQIAQDELLIAQVRAGHFDFLTHNSQDALKWLEDLRR